MRRYAGALGAAILAAVSAIVVALNYKGLNYTVSNHSAANPPSTIAFCVLGTIAALLTAYALLRVVPQIWDVGGGYRRVAGAFALSCIVTCLYPNDPGAVTLHDVGAWAIVASEFVLLVYLLVRLWGQYGALLRAANVLFVAALAVLGVFALCAQEFLWRYILIFEPASMAMAFVLELLLIFGAPRASEAG